MGLIGSSAQVERIPMKLHEKMAKALNTQVTMELASAASYVRRPPSSRIRTSMG
jgi:hypothetical protein